MNGNALIARCNTIKGTQFCVPFVCRSRIWLEQKDMKAQCCGVFCPDVGFSNVGTSESVSPPPTGCNSL